ncbi:hypothetical protein ACLOJK_020323 [Asimina triloba]
MRWALTKSKGEMKTERILASLTMMNMQFLSYTTASLFFLMISSLLALLFHLLFFRNGCKKTANLLPPSPMALLLLGHLHLLGPLLHQSLHALANRYGPIIHLRLGSLGDTVVVSSPALAKEFLKSHDFAFASRLRLVGQEEYLGGEDAISFTFLPMGTRWKFLKKVLMTQLLSAKKLDKTAGIRQQEMQLFLGSLLEKSRGGECADLEEMLAALTHRIICRTTMGMRSTSEGKQEEAEELKKLMQEHIELAGKLNMVHLLMGGIGKLDLFGYGRRLKKANERYMEMVEKIIEEREREMQLETQVDGLDGGSEEEDEYLVDILLKISEDEESKSKLTRHNIKTFLLAIIGFGPKKITAVKSEFHKWPCSVLPRVTKQKHDQLASYSYRKLEFVRPANVSIGILHTCSRTSGGGTETSAITLLWALAELLRHPITFRKAREEIDSVVGTSRIVQESDIPNLPYIQAVVKETLRLHPPIPINIRTCREDCTVAGFYIPKDTKLFVNVWSLGRDPEQWENPLEFRPERFFNSNIDMNGQHFQFLPFGSGRRICPGVPLALAVIQVTIAAMVQCFDWMAPNGDFNSIKMDLKEKAGFTNHMAQPLCCIPMARCVPFTNPLAGIPREIQNKQLSQVFVIRLREGQQGL